MVRAIGPAPRPAPDAQRLLVADVTTHPGIASILSTIPVDSNWMLAAERAALRGSNLIATLELLKCPVLTAQREQSEIFHLRDSLRQ